jgi:pimeloyl-ACP methyl ester carboxylesterase
MPHLYTKDTTQLFYTDEGAGEPFVFVASAWLNSQMWEFQVPYFVNQGFRCIAYDRRGHGRSDWPSAGYDCDTLADDLASVIDHLDLHDVSLVSHSAGAGEVVRYLARHGADRIARIAIVAGTTPFLKKTQDNPEGIDQALMEADLALRTADRAKWFGDHADSFFGVGLPGTRVSHEFVQFMIRQCLSCSARATSEFFLNSFNADLRSDIRAITVPALVIHGDRDAQAPLAICGANTAALIPKSTFLVYENAAHGLFVTHSDRLNGDLLAFTRIGLGADAVIPRGEARDWAKDIAAEPDGQGADMAI